MKNRRSYAVWFLSLSLLACASDLRIQPEPAPPTRLRALTRRMPFLEPLLADASARPAQALAGRGFVVEGSSKNGGLKLSADAQASGAMKLSTGGAAVSVRRKGASDREGRVDRGVVVYEDAFGGDVLVVSRGEGVEELVVTRSPDEELVYEVDLRPGWRLAEHRELGLVEVRDERNTARVRLWANHAWDGQGKEVPVEVAAAGSEVRLKARGAAVIDPYFVGVGAMATGAYDRQAVRLQDGRVLIAGGRLDGFNNTIATDAAEIYDPAAGAFSLTAEPMAVARLEHTMTLLPDGKVLIIGAGLINTNKVTELFDPQENTFSKAASIKTPRHSHAASRLPDGRVLITGGFDGKGETNNAELYDPESGSFSSLPAKMKQARGSHTSTPLPDGKVLLAGGRAGAGQLQTAEIYDPASQTFTATKSNLKKARVNHSAAQLPGGKVLITGGSGAFGAAHKSADLYDPDTGTFSLVDMMEPRMKHTATAMPGGRVLVFGGLSDQTSQSAEVYDAATGVFSFAVPDGLPLRSRHTATSLLDGTVLIAGGIEGTENSTEKGLASAELFDGALSVASAQMNERRDVLTATTLPDGRILLVGGATQRFGKSGFDISSKESSRSAEIFDPSTNTLSPSPLLLNNARFEHTATTLPDGRMLFAGGSDAKGVLDSAEVYDPITQRFASVSKMGEARRLHTATLLPDGKVLIAGGAAGYFQFGAPVECFSSVEIYDPITKKFSPATGKMTAARSLHTATLLPDGKVLFVGGMDTSKTLKLLDSAEVYDPTTQTSTPAGKTATSHIYHTATSLQDGRVLIASGSSAQIFDPTTQTFSPPIVMKVVRDRHTATLLPDGKVLLVGGEENAEKPSVLSAELFDPIKGTFSLAAPPVHSRSQHAAALLGDGRVLIAGGHGSSAPSSTTVFSSVELYDPGTNAFSLLGEENKANGLALTELLDGRAMITGSASPARRISAAGLDPQPLAAVTPGHHTASLRADGAVMIVGGESSSKQATFSDIQEILPDGTAQKVGELEAARAYHSTTRLPDGRWLVAGGESKEKPLDSCEILSPDGSTSEKTITLSTPRTRHAAALTPDGSVLLIGGKNLKGAIAEYELINPKTGETITEGDAKVGEDASATFIGGASLLVSGSLKSIRIDLAGLVVSNLEVGAGFRLMTMASGRALACGEGCRVIGVGGSDSPVAFGWNLGAGGLLRALGTTGVVLMDTRGEERWLGQGQVLPQGAKQPTLQPLSRSAWRSGESGVVEGTGWTAGEPASSINQGLTLAWKPLDGAGPVHPVTVKNWLEGSLEFTLPRTVYTGPGWLYLSQDGVPSEGQLLVMEQAAQGDGCGEGAQCSTGICVDGVCCNELCDGVCQACSASLKGQGKDGVCEPIAKAGAPRPGGCAPTADQCGPKSGLCDGAGACEVPDASTVCTEVPNGRCQKGSCLRAPGAICDEKLENSVLEDGQTVSCLALGVVCDPATGSCKGRCDSSADCAPGFRCNSAQLCEKSVSFDVGTDPGACSVGRPGLPPSNPAALLLLAAVCLGSRRRRAVAAAAITATVSPLLVAQTPAASTSAAPSPPGSSAPAAPSPPGSSAPPAASSAASDAQREKARDLLKRGVALDQAGEPQKALDFFLQSRAAFPAKGNTLNIARTLEKLGRIDEALEMYEEAVASFSRSFDEDDQREVPADMARLRPQLGAAFVSASTTGILVIDGRERATLPMRNPIRLLPGLHAVRVLKDGYRSFEGSVSVKAGETARLDAPMEPLREAGGLKIEDPAFAGAEIEVDGVRVGTLPWEGTLAPGPHVVSARKGEQGTAPTMATVLQGQTVLLRLKFERLGPVVRVKTRPATAEIRLGKVPLGRGSWEGFLPAGAHTFSASEEGYTARTLDLTLPVQDGTEPGRDAEILLPVDEAHPRWPRKATGKISASLLAMYGLGTSFNGGVSDGCAERCSEGLVNGPATGIEAEYEFPFRLGLGLSGGFLSLQNSVERGVERVGGRGAPASASYQFDELHRFKGYWLGALVSFRIPFGGSWSLRPALRGGVVFARVSSTVTGRALAGGQEAPVAVDRSGEETSATPLFLLPEVGLTRSFSEWQVGAALGLWMTIGQGPSLPNGDVRVFLSCNKQQPSSAGCLADWAPEPSTAYGFFAMAAPRLWLARAF